MPRPRRIAAPGCTFHVVNRGNDKRQLFFEDADYQRFLDLLDEGKQLRPVKLFGVCVMSNHFHAILQPSADDALSAYLQWVTGCYACNLRTKTQTRGHGRVPRRFWSRPIVDELHFLTVLRYSSESASCPFGDTCGGLEVEQSASAHRVHAATGRAAKPVALRLASARQSPAHDSRTARSACL